MEVACVRVPEIGTDAYRRLYVLITSNVGDSFIGDFYTTYLCLNLHNCFNIFKNILI